MISKLSYWLFVGLAFCIGLYPLSYFVLDRHFGLLQTKTKELLADPIWNTFFYIHIIFGGIALLIGWIQFSKNLRTKKIQLHRNIGKMYFVSVLLSGTSGLYVAMFATGGIVSITGFALLALVWLATSIRAYTAVRSKNILLHEKMMIYSYAACFSAVTLRIFLGLGMGIFKDFDLVYPICAWLCWVPNILIAHFVLVK